MSGTLRCNEGMHVSFTAIHWRRLWEIPPIIAVKSNVTNVSLVLRFIVNMFYCFRIFFFLLHLNMPVLKVWGCTLRAQRPLTTGIVRQRFPSLRHVKGTTWCNDGRSSWNGSRFEQHSHVYVENTSIHRVRVKWKCHGISVWYKTKFGSQNLATKFGNHLCMATKIGSQC